MRIRVERRGSSRPPYCRSPVGAMPGTPLRIVQSVYAYLSLLLREKSARVRLLSRFFLSSTPAPARAARPLPPLSSLLRDFSSYLLL